jgi:ribosome-binding factor A
MPKNFSRTSRVGDHIHRILANIIAQEFKDPRAGMITLSQVNISPDLRQAKVFITVLPEEKILETVNILNQAAGFFRSRLAKQLALRVVPRLQFVYDELQIKGLRMGTLLAKIACE